MSRMQWWLFGGVLLLAIGLRLWQLGQIPVSLYWDEAAILADAKVIADNGRDMHGRGWLQTIFPSYGDYKLPVYIWLASASVKLFGVSQWALRLPSAVFGVITVVVAGWLAKAIIVLLKERQSKMTIEPATAQLLTMLVVALTPWSVLFSRTGFEGHVAQALVAISIACLFKSKQQWWWLILSALIGALATYGYFSVRFVWPVVFVASSLWLWWPVLSQFKPTRSRAMQLVRWGVIRLVVPLAVFGLGLVPMMRSPLYADSNRFRLNTESVLNNGPEIIQSNIYRELAGNSPFDRVAFHRWWLTARELADNYADHLSLQFMFVSGDDNLRHGTGEHGLFVVGLIPVMAAGWWVLAKKDWGIVAVLLGWWLVALLPASVPENTPHALRSLNALVPLSVVAGIGAAWLASRWRAKWLVPVLLALAHVPFIYHYFTFYPADSAHYWQVNYAQVAQTIVSFRTAQQPVRVISFDERFYLWLFIDGPYRAHDIQSWPTRQYQFATFDGITFEKGLPTGSGEVIVAGRAEEVRQVLAGCDCTVLEQREIPERLPADTYLVLKLLL